MKQSFLSILFLLLPMLASADENGLCGENVIFYYEEATKTLTISTLSGTGAMSDFYLSNYSWSSHVKNVIIEDGVTSISAGAFYECSFTSISIPNSVTSIGESAFGFCPLTSITIPDNVTSMGKRAFYCCNSLTSVTIGDGVTSIGTEAFLSCSKMTSLTIGNGVVSIGKNAFQGCSSLTSLIIPKSVTSIGNNAFSFCDGLTSVTIPNNVTSIGKEVFSYCRGLTDLTIDNSSISENAFANCSKLTKIELGKSIKTIASGAFASCENLTDVTCLSKSVPFLSSDAFDNTENTTLHVYESSIEDYKATSPWSSFKTIVAADIPKYTITYMLDDKAYKTYTLEKGETITPEEAPTKEGYTFSGWSEIPETMPAEDVTVTGTFTINKYKLTYVVDGEEYKSYEVEFATSITPEEAPTKEGYTFSGWSEIPETMPAKDLTITGTFTINKYKLTYMVDGEEYKSYEVEYGASITPEEAPTKEKYTFSGWSEIPETMPANDVTITGTFTKISLGKCATPTISADGGKLSFACETEDVEFFYEITNLDSKTGSGKDVELTNSYIITVYATKTDYDDSDVAKAEIKVAGGKQADANGDGTVDAADIVTIVNIIMGK